jgi:hypothetical protein
MPPVEKGQSGSKAVLGRLASPQVLGRAQSTGHGSEPDPEGPSGSVLFKTQRGMVMIIIVRNEAAILIRRLPNR